MSASHPLQRKLDSQITALNNLKRTINNVRVRRESLSSQPVARGGLGLEQALRKILPSHLMPKNVGHLFHTQWMFEHVVDFDLTTTEDWPDISSNTRQTQEFTVSQEAAFIFFALSRHANDNSSAGDLGPLQIDIRDRQSSRFFNNAPIPIQMIGKNGYEYDLPTPFLVMPNAKIEVEMSSWLEPGVLQNSIPAPTGIHQFIFKGYRMRIEDAEKILSSVFG